jgi:hypothetical protein
MHNISISLPVDNVVIPNHLPIQEGINFVRYKIYLPEGWEFTQGVVYLGYPLFTFNVKSPEGLTESVNKVGDLLSSLLREWVQNNSEYIYVSYRRHIEDEPEVDEYELGWYKDTLVILQEGHGITPYESLEELVSDYQQKFESVMVL